MKVSIRKTETGYKIRFRRKNFPVIFPKRVWRDFPDNVKDAFIDNMGFIQVMEAPFFLSLDRLSLNTNTPLLKSVYFKGLINFLPFSSDVDRKPAVEEIKKYLNIRYHFNGPMRVPKTSLDFDNRSVVSLTFGKDSTLSYALSEEIGQDPVGVTIFEGGLPFASSHKRALVRRFEREFGKKIYSIRDNTLELSDYSYYRLPRTQFGFCNSISGYALILLPVNFAYRAGFTIIGNEQSCNDYYKTKEGFKAFPVYDQTARFTKACDVMTKALSGGAVSTVSLIEPIHELGVMKVLHRRYPKYAKYQMSCFPDDHKSGMRNRWCQRCSKCARMYIFCRAINVNPKTLGFNEDMLKKGKIKLYSIFGDSKGDVPFDLSGIGRDEQLLSFYLAWKNGARGYLINKFRKLYLNEAREREGKLVKTFFSIHPSTTIPKKIKKEVVSIFREEL